MKKILFNLGLIISIFIFAQILYAFNPKLEFDILDIDFKGVCSNSRAVVAYGDYFTNTLVSTDKGKTWSHKMILSLFNTLNKLVVYNDIFYGIADSSIIVKSSDGIHWSSFFNPINEKFIDIAADSNYIYLVSAEKNKIFVLDMNAQSIETLPFDYEVTEIFSFNNNLFIGTSSGQIIIMNFQKYSVSILNVAKFGKKIQKFIADENRIYFVVDTTLCTLNKDFTSAELVLANAPLNFTIRKGEIYYLKNEITYVFSRIARWIGFYRYNKNLNQFVKVNNDNLNRYIENFDTFLPNFELKFSFIDDDNIIVVSANKTILMSTNGGKNWELRCFLVPGYGTDLIFVLNNYIWKAMGKMILRSTDFGVTWLPQKADSLFIISLASIGTIRFIFFDTSGKGCIVNSVNYYYSDSTRNFGILLTNDYGENYKNKYYKLGDKVQLDWLGIAENYLSEMIKFKDRFVLKRVNWQNLNAGRKPYSHLEFYDTNFTFTDSRRFNDTVLLKILYLGNPDTLFGYFWTGTYSDTAFAYYKDIKSWIGYTCDGYNWEKLFDVDVNEYYYKVWSTPYGPVGVLERYYDSTLAQAKSFFVDVQKRKTVTLFNKYYKMEEYDFYNYPIVDLFTIANDKVFYSEDIDKSPILVCDLSSQELPNWKPTNIFEPFFVRFNNELSLSPFLTATDSIFYFFIATPLGSAFLVKATIRDSMPSAVEEEGVTNKFFELDRIFVQVQPPFPQPASNFVKAKIYIEQFNDIYPEFFKLYDISGNPLQLPLKVTLEKLSPFLFLANIDVSSLPNGIYFVRYTKQETEFFFPIIVYR